MVHVEGAGEVHCNQLVPELGLGFQERHEAVETGVVDQHRGHAQIAFDSRHRLGNSRIIGDIGGVGAGLATGFGDQVHRGLGCGFVTVQNRNQAAFFGEAQGYGAADAATTTGNNDCFSVKTFHRLFSCCSE